MKSYFLQNERKVVMRMDIFAVLLDEFKLKKEHIKNAIELLDEGNTIPFIARYRKEVTGEMQDSVLRDLFNRLTYLRNLESKKEEVIRLIDEQGKLTDELKSEITKAITLQRVDDLYRPYRQKRRTRATMAKEKGLEELSNIIMDGNIDEASFKDLIQNFVDEEKEVMNEEEALAGAMDIIAETISDDPDYRAVIKRILHNKGVLTTEAVDKEESTVYDMYYNYSENIKTMANHRVLAINRGEKDKKLKVSIKVNDEEIIELLKSKIIEEKHETTGEYIEAAIEDGYKRLLMPSIEREIRNNLTETAEEEAIKVFSINLKPLLLQPPIKGKAVMAVDPGFRTGCKLAVMNDTGLLLDYATIYPTAPQNKVEQSKTKMMEFIKKYNVNIIAIGNGTASRETEVVVAEMIQEAGIDVSYIIVSEAGASIYSASEAGIKEFPDLDVTIRGAVSIGRRLQDPLAELVKIEPRHIGVGQYQHDLNQGRLDEALTGVVEDCVNSVGVDLNTASSSLFKYVAGVSTRVANSLVAHREEVGKFNTRKELLKVKGLGPKTYEQCAGFMRISDGKNPLDNTGVHPESYDIANRLLEIGYKDIEEEKIIEEFDIGDITLRDIIKELEKPGRDPRDEMPKPILRSDVLSVDDLVVDMVLKGTVRNVVDFGAFVDIGIKGDGLVHISHLSNKFIKHPKEVVQVGDVVNVRILDIDKAKDRVSLSMKDIK